MLWYCLVYSFDYNIAEILDLNQPLRLERKIDYKRNLI